MPGEVEVEVVRVFCDPEGGHGNELGIVREGAALSVSQRQAAATELGFAETVFVEDQASGRVAIHTPEVELGFAGHPMVGTAWLLAGGSEAEGVVEALPSLRPPAGEVTARREGELVWIAGRPQWGPPFEFVELAGPDDVEALNGAPEGYGEVGAWAWLDREAGTIRERVFVPEVGVVEDEATGSAAIRLCSQLGRPIEIHQGRGSVLHVHPLDDGRCEVGGRVRPEPPRSVELTAGLDCHHAGAPVAQLVRAIGF